VLSVVLVATGRLPDYVVSTKYREASRPSVVRILPTHVDVQKWKNPPQWLSPYDFWLEREADDLKQKNKIKGYMIEKVKSPEISATPEFYWVLKPAPGFALMGWAFERTIDESAGLFRPLERTLLEDGSIRFTVPQSKKGDWLFAILRVSWAEHTQVSDFLETLRSVVQQK